MTLDELKTHREYFNYFRDLPHGVMAEIFDAFEAELDKKSVTLNPVGGKPKKLKTEAE